MSQSRIVVLISGSGSNLQALLDAVADGRLPVEIALVVSNRKTEYGLVRAEQAGIPTLYHPFKTYRDAGKSRDEYEADLAAKIKPIQPDLLVLAGWMHILGTDFLTQFPNQVINLHPALPGQFAGTHAIDRAYAAYQNRQISHSGCMVHTVIPEVDAGAVIIQAQVPIQPNDTLADFEKRMHATEHRIIVEAVEEILVV